jgi:MFS family permease
MLSPTPPPASSSALARLFNVAGIPHAFTLAALNGVHCFGLALPITVMPLHALDLLGDAQRVSLLFLAVGLVGLTGAFTVPMLVELLGRRRAAMAGTLCIVGAAPLLAAGTAAAFAAGAALYTYGYFCVDVAVSVAIMERVPRQAFSRFEPLRMACIGAGFTAGPWLGVTLAETGGLWLPFAAMATCAMGVCAFGLARGFVTNQAGLGVARANPLRYVPRFARQPRLRLGWFMAAARSAWWNVFFVYGPIYCVENGFSDRTAGLVVSLGTVAVMLSPLWGRLFAPVGLRGLLATGFVATGLVTMLLPLAGAAPAVVIALLLTATVTASWIDAGGNALFLRAVHPHERAEMASVHATFRDAGRLAPLGTFTLVLLVLPLEAVFVITGAATLAVTYWTRYIPRRY